MKKYKVVLLLFIISFCLLTAINITSAYSQDTTKKKAQDPSLSEKELQNIIKTLEDPKKREELIRTLKALSVAQREVEKKQQKSEFNLKEYLSKLSDATKKFESELQEGPLSVLNLTMNAIKSKDFIWNMGILSFAGIISKTVSMVFRRRLYSKNLAKTTAGKISFDILTGISDVLLFYLLYTASWYFTKLYARPYDILYFLILLYLIYALIIRTIDVLYANFQSKPVLESIDQDTFKKTIAKLKKITWLFLAYVFLNQIENNYFDTKGFFVPLIWVVLVLIAIRATSLVNLISGHVMDFLIKKNKHGYSALVSIGKITLKVYIWFSFFEAISTTFYPQTGLHLLITKTLVIVLLMIVLHYGIRWSVGRIGGSKTYLSWSQDIGENIAKGILYTVKNIVYVFAVFTFTIYLIKIWAGFFKKDLSHILNLPYVVNCVHIIIILGACVSVYRLSSFLSYLVLERLLSKAEEQRRRRMKTIMPIFENGIKIGTVFVGGVLILNKMGVNVGPILAGAGIVGLAVGFGAQTFVKDLINGLFIIFEEVFNVGDVISIAGKTGVVEMVGIRAIRLRDIDGSLHLIPNSEINIISNMTKGFSRALLDIGVAYREDVDYVMGVLRELGDEMLSDPDWQKDILEPLEILGVDRFEDSQVVIRARFTTRPLRQWAVRREFLRRVKKRFDELGIEIPFPHLTLYMGKPKEGQAPPMNVYLLKDQDGN